MSAWTPPPLHSCLECGIPIYWQGFCTLHIAFDGTDLRREQDEAMLALGIPYWDREHTLRRLSQVLAVVAYAGCLCSGCGEVTMQGDHVLCAGMRAMLTPEAVADAEKRTAAVMGGFGGQPVTFSVPEWRPLG